MNRSKHAPKTPLEQLKQSKAEKLKVDKDRAAQLLVRLQWKAEMLCGSYDKAIKILYNLKQPNCYDESEKDFMKRAESMFKLDFFEFYTFLERYLTHCLAAVGVSVSGSLQRENFNALRYITNPDLHRTRPLATHAFHANLLEALDDEKCPLYPALGSQDARIQLGLAKDYRNAWKDADGRGGSANGYTNSERSHFSVALTDLKLIPMLETIVAACKNGNAIVQAYEGTGVDVKSSSGRDFEPPSHSYDAMVRSDLPFEYMDVATDEMELD